MIILSDDKPIKVKQLGIFELDNIKPKLLGPFTYKMATIGGKEYDAIFDPEAWDIPPQKPETPKHEIKEKSAEWYAYQDWELYNLAVAHEEKRKQQLIDYVENVAEYIVENCIPQEDVARIKTAEDWKKIYDAALVPQLTTEVLADTFARTYQAEFNGMPILDALEEIASDGGSKLDTIKQWENELMIKMQLTEIEYVTLSLEERARKVAAMVLPKLMESLEMEKSRREQEAKHGKS